MSVFNHMGKLAKVEGDWAFYDYYPDYFSHEGVFGTFRVKLFSLAENMAVEYTFARRLGCRELGFSRSDEEVVLSLLRKIKAEFASGGRWPERVYHNA